MTQSSIWEDRKLAEVLRHPQMMSVLWAIQHERYTSVEDFERHFHEDLHAEELISALVGQLPNTLAFARHSRWPAAPSSRGARAASQYRSGSSNANINGS